MEKDTIVAISTGQVPAGIAIVRISGNKSIEITDKFFNSRKPLSEASSHTAYFGKIVSEGETVDEALVLVMKGPGTYTGEDVVEINCHGSLIVQKKILDLAIKNGARLAGPGEFTMRAFLAGKMDLSQAESVMDLILSENDLALKASLSNLSGSFSNIIKDIRKKIIYEIAHIEAALDDPEHMSLEGYPDKLMGILNGLKNDIERLIFNAKTSQRIKEGIDCAIIGRVNVGKSSLLNALSGVDKAIVTDIPGTTRDIVEQKINMGNFSLNIIDTAGIRESEDEVENIGIEKSKEHLKNASLVLFVVDASESLSLEDEELIGSLENREAIILLNKSDLKSKISILDVERLTNKPVILVSAKELTGFEDLKEKIEEIFFKGKIKNTEQYFITNERHLLLLEEAKKSLLLVEEAIEGGLTEEIFAVDLTDAYESLGKILGKDLGEDVITEVFSKFCIGK